MERKNKGELEVCLINERVRGRQFTVDRPRNNCDGGVAYHLLSGRSNTSSPASHPPVSAPLRQDSRGLFFFHRISLNPNLGD
jgi:hypothetical protein